MNAQEQFSERERSVIDLLLQGKSNKQIAYSLRVSNRTIEFHLSNIYSKLGVSSRSEAILIIIKNYPALTKNIPSDDGLWKSTVAVASESSDNEKTIHLSQRISMRKRVYLFTGFCLLIALAVFFSILTKNQEHGTRTSPETISPVTPIINSTSIPATQEQILISDHANTFKQTIDSTVVSLTLKWFYIDSTRLNMELVVLDFPLPQGFTPIQIINPREITLQSEDGSSIGLTQRANFGGGGGGGEMPDEERNPPFDEILDFSLNDPQSVRSKETTYVLDIPIGGEVTDEKGEVLTLPLVVFHIEAKPSYTGQLTFSTQKSAVMEDKTVTFKGLEVNPSSAAAVLCSFDPAGEQWLPTVDLIYKGNIFYSSGGGLVDDSYENPNQEMCYRLNYPSFRFDPSDNSEPEISVWIAKLTKDQPERLPYELIAAAQNKLAAEGIEFNYVIINHGSQIAITKKPAELSEREAFIIIQNALTQEATSPDVIIFDLY
jgi:DNA-binding CsgD family transcriptional regulator